MTSLERLTNGSIVLLCVVLAGDVVYKRLAPPSPTPPVRPVAQPVAQPRPSYQVGEIFPALSAFKPARGVASLLLILRDGCKYCDASMPFYQRIAEAGRKAPSRLNVVASCLDPTDVCQAYLAKHSVAVKAISVQGETLKITGTPTLVMVDERGAVEGVWVGQLSEPRQQQVLDAISRRIRGAGSQ